MHTDLPPASPLVAFLPLTSCSTVPFVGFRTISQTWLPLETSLLTQWHLPVYLLLLPASSCKWMILTHSACLIATVEAKRPVNKLEILYVERTCCPLTTSVIAMILAKYSEYSLSVDLLSHSQAVKCLKLCCADRPIAGLNKHP